MSQFARGTARGRPIAWVVIALGALLAAPVPIVAGGPAFGSHPSAGASAWAYGGNRTVNVSGVARNGTFTISSHIGFQVLLGASVGTDGAVAVNGERTMGAVERIEYCSPTCISPALTTAINYHAVERLTGFSNLTNHGTVAVNGTQTPALGLLNASSFLSDTQYENDSLSYHGIARDRVGSANVSVEVSGQITASFTPALGLVPLDITPGMSWVSYSSFTGSGAWQSTSAYHRTTLLGISSSGGTTDQFAANRSGNVTLLGRDLGTLTLRNGVPTQVIALQLQGPLNLREGVLLLPASADPFGGATSLNAPGANASLGESLSGIDYTASAGGPVGVLASASTFTAQSNDPGAASSGGITPAASGESSGPQSIQAQPESPDEFSQSSNCLAVESCAGGAPLSSGVNSQLRPLVVVALAVVALTAILGSAFVVSRRPRTPPRANAQTYPPVRSKESSTRASPRNGTPTSPPDPSEPDPLGHLW